MNLFHSLAGFTVVAVLVVAGCAREARAADGDERTPSFPISDHAKKFVGHLERNELAKDDVFVKALVELAKSDLSPEAKADAFMLMQDKIGWLFVGVAKIHPKHNYAQSVELTLSTYVQYQEKMPAGLDVGPLLKLAESSRNEHPLRPSNALLLATILNYKGSKDAVLKAIDAKAIARTQVPAIDLHNLSLAAALARDPAVVRKNLELLPGLDSEESREDVMAVTSIFRDEKMRDMIEAFLKAAFPKSFDNSVQTALIVLVHTSEPEHFRTFYKNLGDMTKDEKAIKILRDFWDSRFHYALQTDQETGIVLKVWDGFTFTLSEGGGTIAWGKTYKNWVELK